MVKISKPQPRKKNVKAAPSGAGSRGPATTASEARDRRTRVPAAVPDRGANTPSMRQETIGVRELRDSFSERLRSVRAGKTLTVTDHGQPVAMLIPYGLPAGILRMLSEGTLTWSGSKNYPSPFPPDRPLDPSSTEWYMKTKEEDARALDAAISASAADLRR